MRVISKKILRDFWSNHNDAEQALKSWYKEASAAEWSTPMDIKRGYTRASILKNNRVVFRICGNRYRLVVEVNYQRMGIFIRFIGTHREYDNIDAINI